MTSADYAAFSHPTIGGTSAASTPGCRAAPWSTYLRSVTRVGVGLALVALLAATSAVADCPKPTPSLQLPAACVGESTTGSTSFCFAKDCSGSGLVLGVDPPAAPFTVTDVHVDGLLGSGPAVFPLLLAPGESVVADVAVVVPASGAADGRLAWVVASGEDGEGDECEVDLGAAAPVCGGDPSGARWR